MKKKKNQKKKIVMMNEASRFLTIQSFSHSLQSNFMQC